MRQPLAADTDAEVEQRQIDAWRTMTPAQKVTLVLQMSATVRQLAAAGVSQRYPHASAREQFLRLAQVTLGEDLARRVYPRTPGARPPVTDTPDPIGVALRVTSVLDGLGLRHTIGGSIASSVAASLARRSTSTLSRRSTPPTSIRS